MGGGGGGPKTETTTTSNIPYNAGYLNQIDQSASELADKNPLNYYPGQTYAPMTTDTLQYLTNLAAGSASSNNPEYLQNSAMNQNYYATLGQTDPLRSLTSLGQNNPGGSYAGQLNDLASNGTAVQGLSNVPGGPAVSGLNALGSGNTTAGQSLGAFASGSLLGSNPYLDSLYHSASIPLTNSYETATAPQTDSAFNRYNRFDSGANANAQSINQQNLGQSLASLGAQIYEPAYQQDMGNMLTGATNLGNLQDSALTNAGNLTNTAYTNLGNLQNSALTNAGNLNVAGANAEANAASNAANYEQQAINSAGSVSQLPFQDLNTAIGGEQQIQALQQADLTDQANRFYGNENQAWSTLGAEANIVGSPIPGTSTSTSPYYQPSGAQSGLSTGLGVLGAVSKVATK